MRKGTSLWISFFVLLAVATLFSFIVPSWRAASGALRRNAEQETFQECFDQIGIVTPYDVAVIRPEALASGIIEAPLEREETPCETKEFASDRAMRYCPALVPMARENFLEAVEQRTRAFSPSAMYGESYRGGMYRAYVVVMKKRLRSGSAKETVSSFVQMYKNGVPCGAWRIR